MRRTYFLAASLAVATLAGVVGCHTGVLAQSQDQGPDPADRNMAPVDGTTPAQQPVYSQQQQAQQYNQSNTGVVNESQQQANQYSQTGQGGAPIERRGPSNTAQNQMSDQEEDQAYDDLMNTDQDSNSGQQQQPLEADQAPPPLPQYDQPEAPAPDYLWTPGYWGYSNVGYYWVPGVWCAAPYQGALWTPGYWGYYGNRYRFHRGFWGQYIGFYGGINYGFGYYGTGYRGGYWNGPHFYYNRSVNRINVTRITNVYNRNVVVNNFAMNRTSYNGGRGGIDIRPRQAELVAMRGPRIPPMSTQVQLQRQSSQNREQFFSQNRGRPAIVAAPRPIMADRGVQRPTQSSFNRQQQGGQQNRQNGFQSGQGGFQNNQQNRPGGQNEVRPGQIGQQPSVQQVRPDQQNQQGRPAQGGFQPGQNGQQNRPGQGGFQPGQVQSGQQAQPGQQVRPVMPQGNSNIRPAQGNFEGRQTTPEQSRPQQQQVRPQQLEQSRPQQIQPQQVRPQQMQQQARPQPQEFRQEQVRPQVQQPRPQQQMQQSRPQPQPRQQSRPQPQPQQQSRPQQGPRGEGHSR